MLLLMRKPYSLLSLQYPTKSKAELILKPKYGWVDRAAEIPDSLDRACTDLKVTD
jgi:hypothetical protein